jgi:hypothetical protein
MRLAEKIGPSSSLSLEVIAMPIFLSEKQVAQQLGISPVTLRRWRWLGEGPRFHKFGRLVRYRTDDIVAFAAVGARGQAPAGSADSAVTS